MLQPFHPAIEDLERDLFFSLGEASQMTKTCRAFFIMIVGFTTSAVRLGGPHFGPSQISLKMLSLKTALLVALTSAKSVSDLHALSVSASCLSIREMGETGF